MRYINVNAVKARAKEFDRRVGKDFLQRFEEYVSKKIDSACMTKNGGKVTLDAGVADFIFGRRR